MNELESIFKKIRDGKFNKNTDYNNIAEAFLKHHKDQVSHEDLHGLVIIKIGPISIGLLKQDKFSFLDQKGLNSLNKNEDLVKLMEFLLLNKSESDFEQKLQQYLYRFKDKKTLVPEEEILILLKEIRETDRDNLSSEWKKQVKDSLVDNEGNSNWVSVSFGNGGDWIRASSPINKYFKVEKKMDKNSIIAFKLSGFADEFKSINNYIPEEIRMKYKGMPCVFSACVHEIMELDHKIGAKRFQSQTDKRLKDEKYYQPVSKTMNDAKRQHCKDCQTSGIRFDAKKLGFNISYVEGKENLVQLEFNENENPCSGCYWYDPIAFRKKL